MKLKTYILGAGLLIAGIIAVATATTVVFSTQQFLNTATTSGSPQQSAFITSTTSLGDATITEILVNTTAQFPIADRLSPWSPLGFDIAGLIACLFFSALVVGFSLARKT